MSALTANGVSEAQRIARHTRTQQANDWTEAVHSAMEVVEKLDAAPVTYRVFVKNVAEAADVDVPTAKRVFEYLEDCNAVTYVFGVGVSPVKRSA